MDTAEADCCPNKTALIEALAVAGPLTSQAGLFNFTANPLLGSTAGSGSTGSGTGVGGVDDVSGTFQLAGTFTGLSGVTGASLSVGAASATFTIPSSGFTVVTGPGIYYYSAVANLTPSQAAALTSGSLFINILSSGSPLGVISGNIPALGAPPAGGGGGFTPVPEPETSAAMAGAALVGFGVWRRARR